MRYFILLFLWILSVALMGCYQNQSLKVTSLETADSIIGGSIATPSEFPFLVNIWLNTPKDNYVAHHCGGSLIHKKWVLTAAHCVLQDASDRSEGLIKSEDLQLYLGSIQVSGEGGRLLKVKSIQIHPQFSWPHYDVALIELLNEIQDVPVLSLNTVPIQDFKLPMNAIVMGWGLTDKEGRVDAEIVNKVSVPVTSSKICTQDEFVRKKGWKISEDILCVETNLNTRSSCPGDSGGPLITSKNGQYVQIGIVSWGSACRWPFDKIQSNIEGYANVAYVYGWIQQVINK